MPETVERPETRPEFMPGRNPLEHFEYEGLRLEILWRIQPVVVEDVYRLFSGLEALLKRGIEAFLIAEGATEEDSRKLVEALLQIEVEQLELGSVRTIWKFTREKLDSAQEHLREAAVS